MGEQIREYALGGRQQTAGRGQGRRAKDARLDGFAKSPKSLPQKDLGTSRRPDGEVLSPELTGR